MGRTVQLVVKQTSQSAGLNRRINSLSLRQCRVYPMTNGPRNCWMLEGGTDAVYPGTSEKCHPLI
ncbi:MAG: hypothetical protein IPI50_15140 [Saprospiraceae bacterium]|nr:hypothetical protein [Saprospiraceae bacterium]